MYDTENVILHYCSKQIFIVVLHVYRFKKNYILENFNKIIKNWQVTIYKTFLIQNTFFVLFDLVKTGTT